MWSVKNTLQTLHWQCFKMPRLHLACLAICSKCSDWSCPCRARRKRHPWFWRSFMELYQWNALHKKRCLSRLRSAVAPRLSNWRLLWKLLSLAQASPHFTKFTLRVTKRCGSHCLWHVSPSRQVVFHAFHVTDWAISMSDGTGDTGFTGRAVGQPNSSRSAQMLKDYLHCVSGSRSYHARQRRNLRISMATVCQPLPLDQNPSPRHEKETSLHWITMFILLPASKTKPVALHLGQTHWKGSTSISFCILFDSCLYSYLFYFAHLRIKVFCQSTLDFSLGSQTWQQHRCSCGRQWSAPHVANTENCSNSFKGCEKNILISRFHSKQM